jgi:hypothetical protein
VLTPQGLISLNVTPETVRVGDILTIDGLQIGVVDMRAVDGKRDSVVLTLATGELRVMRMGDRFNALRNPEQGRSAR